MTPSSSSGMYDLNNNQTLMIPIDEIQAGVNIKNIRTTFDDESVKTLAEGIFRDGLLNPIIVMQTQDANGDAIVELVAGARRLRAVQYILEVFDPAWNDGEVKCTMFVGTVEDACFLNGIENIEREEIDGADLCEWLLRQVEEYGHSQDELATRLHRSASWVSSKVTVARQGSESLMKALREGLLSVSAAYELAKSMTKEEQDKRIAQARKNAEKLITTEAAKNETDVEHVKKPSKKKLANLLAKAEQASANPKKRNAHGIAMGLRYVAGLATESEVIEAMNWEGLDAGGTGSASDDDNDDIDE